MDRTTKTATLAAVFMMAAAGNASAQDLYSERLPLHLELSLSAQTPYKGLMSFGPEIDLTTASSASLSTLLRLLTTSFRKNQ